MSNLETKCEILIETDAPHPLWDLTIEVLDSIFSDQESHFDLGRNPNTPTVCAFDMLPIGGNFRNRLCAALEKEGYLFLSDFLNAGGDDDIAVMTYKLGVDTRVVEVEFTKVRYCLRDGSVAFRLERGDEDKTLMSLVFRPALPAIPSITRRTMEEIDQTALPATFPMVELLEEFDLWKKSLVDKSSQV